MTKRIFLVVCTVVVLLVSSGCNNAIEDPETTSFDNVSSFSEQVIENPDNTEAEEEDFSWTIPRPAVRIKNDVLTVSDYSLGLADFIDVYIDDVLVASPVFEDGTESYHNVASCDLSSVGKETYTVKVIAKGEGCKDADPVTLYYRGEDISSKVIAEFSEDFTVVTIKINQDIPDETIQNSTIIVDISSDYDVYRMKPGGNGSWGAIKLNGLKNEILKSAVVEDGVTYLNEAFTNCLALQKVTLTNDINECGNSVFRGCINLTSVTIPNKLETIEAWMFADCASLSSIIIPNTITKIDAGAFKNCTSLKSIIMPDGVTSIGSGAFEGCVGLTDINIPGSVTKIGDDAFKDCTGLTKVDIPTGVTSMGDGTFDGCANLTSVTIPDTMTKIGYSAFRRCKGLTSVGIPSGVSKIDMWSFLACENLTSVDIPDSVTEIGEQAFLYCVRLTQINYGGTKAQWNKISKDGTWNQNTGKYVICCADGEIVKP